MTEKEALTRIKTGYFGNDYGFDWQILVDTVGTIGEMFRKGQIDEVVRCKECEYYQEGPCINIDGKPFPWCKGKARVYGLTKPDWFCADGKRRNTDESD